MAWVDRPGGRVGVSSSSRSLVFEPTPTCDLLLTHIKPGRGSGGSALEIREGDEPVSYLVTGPRSDSLDVAGGLLSRFWDLSLRQTSRFDE